MRRKAVMMTGTSTCSNAIFSEVTEPSFIGTVCP